MRIVIAGGGTAGHVFPAVALARRLVEEYGAAVRFLGTRTGLEATLVPEAGFAFTSIEARPLYREISGRALRAPFAAVRSVGRCVPLVAGADAVVGMGGYVSVPVVVAAARTRRPIVLHEQNAVPGLANRVLSRWARVVALSFAEAARGFPRRVRSVVTGNPVREEILRVDQEREALAAEARRSLDLEEGRRTVAVFGGSQGALRIDRAVVAAVPFLRERSDLQLLVLTGPAHHDLVREGIGDAGKLVVRTLPFLERMELAYSVADLVVGRAGATSIAEVTACGLPSILVPYPHATGRHQDANARAVETVGGAVITPDASLSGPVLAAAITKVLDEDRLLKEMADRARAWGRRDAAAALTRVVADAATEEGW